VSELAHEATGYEVVEEEPPEQLARNLTAAGYLLASATAFFFLAFLFAYFYLRAVNNGGMWRPSHIDPSTTLGTLLTAAFVASAILVQLGLRDHRADRRPAWRLKGAVAFALGLTGVVLQAVEWSTQGFGPTEGGYASVYFGWTGTYLAFAVGALYWLETVLATSIRYRMIPSGAPAAGEASGDPHRPGHDIRDPLSLVRAQLVALNFFWTFLAGIGVLTWIVLYLV
jgi:heme/copper-type cytochrome/quinol oxidase subunit 3